MAGNNFFGDFAPARNDAFVVAPDPRRVADDARKTQRENDRDARLDDSARRSDDTARRAVDTAARAEETARRAGIAAARMPEGTRTNFEKMISEFGNLDRVAQGFDPNYLGVGSGIENFAQSYLGNGVGTPGQSQWWSDFKGTDNLIRNELFGASLTGGEKAAYAATTISPDMAPDVARANVERRRGIIQKAVERRRDALLAEGYNPEAIAALTRDILPSGAAATSPDGDPTKKAIPPGMQKEESEWLARNDPRADPDAYADFRVGLDTKYGFSGGNRDAYVNFGRTLKPGGRFGPIPPADGISEADRGEIERARQNTGAVGAGIYGAADTMSLGWLDEAGSALEASFGSGQGTWQDRYDNRLAVNRGMVSGIKEDNGEAYMTGQIAGAFAPMGAASLARLPGGVAMAGGLTGATYGAGSADGSITDRLIGAGTGGVIGAGAGAAFQAGSPYIQQLLQNRAAGRAVQPQSAGRDVLEAAQRLNVPVLPADVGGPMSRLATAASAQSIVSAGPVVRAANASIDAQASARGTMAASEGAILAPDEAGALVRKAGERLIGDTSARGGRMYTRAGQLSQGVKVTPTSAIQAIDGHIFQAQQAGDIGQPIVDQLTKLRNSLAQPNGLTPDGIRAIRTATSQAIRDNNLRGTNTQRIINDVLAATTQDFERGLVNAGKPQAVNAFRRADQFWRERVEHIDEVLEPVIGAGKSGEDILGHLNTMAEGGRGGIARLRGVLNGMNPQEVGNVRATFIDRLGRATKDNGETDTFSPARFVTQWNNMSTKAKQAMFGNSELRASLDDLATVAGGSTRADRYRNSSNTGGVAANIGGGAGVGAVFATGGVGAVPLIGGAILMHATSRLMASPGFARIVARAPRQVTQQSINWTLARIEQLAIRTPALAADLAGVQQGLLAQLTNPASRAMAESEQNPGNAN